VDTLFNSSILDTFEVQMDIGEHLCIQLDTYGDRWCKWHLSAKLPNQRLIIHNIEIH
jgi:hypothetical protein